MSAGDWLPLAQRVLSCEWADRRGRDGWCETHDDPWPCGRAQEAADVLAEEERMAEHKPKTYVSGGFIPPVSTTIHVPPKFTPTPTPIDPADIRPGDVVRVTREVAVNDVVPKAGGEAWINGMWVVGPGEAHLVHRPDPDAEAVEALERAALPKDDSSPAGFQGWWNILSALREQGWDVVRRAES